MTVLLPATVAAAVAGSVTQAVTGFGFALVAVPLLALVAPPATAVVIVTIVSAALTTGA